MKACFFILVFFYVFNTCSTRAQDNGHSPTKSSSAPTMRWYVMSKDTTRISIPDSIFRLLPCGVVFRDSLHGVMWVKICGINNDSIAILGPDSIMVDSENGLKRTQAQWLFQAQGCLKYEIRYRSARWNGNYFKELDTLIIKDTCATGTGCVPIFGAIGDDCTPVLKDAVCDTLIFIGKNTNVNFSTGKDSIIIEADTSNIPLLFQIYRSGINELGNTDSSSYFHPAYFSSPTIAFPLTKSFAIKAVAYNALNAQTGITAGGEYIWHKSMLLAATWVPAPPWGSTEALQLSVKWVQVPGNDRFSIYVSKISAGSYPAVMYHVANVSFNDAANLPVGVVPGNTPTYITLTVWIYRIDSVMKCSN